MGRVEQNMELWSRVRGWYPVSIAGQSYRCDPDHISFWSKVTRGEWEATTFEFLDRLTSQGSVHCDIGAWIGPTVLHSASRSAKVYCLEPDREAYMYLLHNLRLNKLDNVMPFNLALSVENTLCTMSSPRGKRGDSMTSLLKPDGERSQEVLCLTWQTWLDLIGNPQFHSIKMDIEGAEFLLLPEMGAYLKRYSPGLYLSLHPHLLPVKDRHQAMARVVEQLKTYSRCCDSTGKEIGLEALMEEQAMNLAGSYLLLP